MAFNQEEWEKGMRRKLGPDWREKRREWSAQGGRARVSKGFGRMTPEQRAEASRKGVEARRAKYVAEQ